MATVIDCVVVGYNESDMGQLLERARPFREISGGYRHLLVNSVPFQGRRGTYFDLLNMVRAKTGVREEPLHVSRLPNLAVCYLVSFLRRRGLRVEFVNAFTHDQRHFEQLLAARPRMVAITTTFYFEAAPIAEIVAFVRSRSPTTKTVVGGPHVFNVCSDNPIPVQDSLFREMGADIFVFDSQGEDTLANLCTEFRRESPKLDLVSNLIMREAGSFKRTMRIPEHNSMDANPIDWRQFDQSFLRPVAQTRTARSCAYKCAFCRYPVMAGELDLMRLETIEHELDALHAAGTIYLLFIDDTFNIPMARFKDICRLLIRKRYGFKWFSYFRCASADLECFDLMAESGCTGVFLGIESGDDRILRSMNKVATTAKYASGIRELKARNIITYASFIVGFPPETEETAGNTLQFIKETAPTFYCLETFFFDPKVPIGQRAAEFDLTGQAYSWKHRTMDWLVASSIVERGYRAIADSVFLPLYGFDLWSVAYLMGQGLSCDMIAEFLRAASRLMLNSTADDGHDASVDEERLTRLLSSTAMA